MSSRATAMPASANERPMAAPSPEPPPVIPATRPASSIVMSGSAAPRQVGGLDGVELVTGLVGGAAQDDPAAFHQVHAVRDPEGLAHVLLDEEHPDALLGGGLADCGQQLGDDDG